MVFGFTLSGIVSPFLFRPLVANLQVVGFSFAHSWPSTLSKLWFSWRITTTWWIGTGVAPPAVAAPPPDSAANAISAAAAVAMAAPAARFLETFRSPPIVLPPSLAPPATFTPLGSDRLLERRTRAKVGQGNEIVTPAAQGQSGCSHASAIARIAALIFATDSSYS